MSCAPESQTTEIYLFVFERPERASERQTNGKYSCTHIEMWKYSNLILLINIRNMRVPTVPHSTQSGIYNSIHCGEANLGAIERYESLISM